MRGPKVKKNRKRPEPAKTDVEKESCGVISIKIEKDSDDIIAPIIQIASKNLTECELNKRFKNPREENVAIKQEPISIVAFAPLKHDRVKLEAEKTADRINGVFSQFHPSSTTEEVSSPTSEIRLKSGDHGFISSGQFYPLKNTQKLEPDWVDLVRSVKVETEDDLANAGLKDAPNQCTEIDLGRSDYFEVDVLPLKPCSVVLKRIDELKVDDCQGAIKFTCDHCKTLFDTKKALTFHIAFDCSGLKVGSRVAENPAVTSKHICDHCKHVFKRREFLVKHTLYHCVMNRSKPSNVDRLCYYNQAGLPRSDGMKENRPLCGHCGKYFACPGSLTKHIKTVHGMKNVSKPSIGKKHRKKSEENVSKPSIGKKNRKKSEGFFCNRCNKAISEKTSFIRHQYYHKYCKDARLPKKQRGVCKVCGATFDDSYDFNWHMRWAHVKAKTEHRDRRARKYSDKNKNGQIIHRKFCCDVCGRTFEEYRGIKRHILRSQREGSKLHSCPLNFLNCEYCGKQFTSESSLNTHLRREQLQGSKDHPEISDGASFDGIDCYTCNHCQKLFFSKHGLLKHIKRHMKP